MRWSKTDKEIIHRISLEEMIPEKEVELMIHSQFALMKEVIESGSAMQDTLKNIMLPRFGKFYFSKYMIAKYRENNGKFTDVVRHDDELLGS